MTSIRRAIGQRGGRYSLYAFALVSYVLASVAWKPLLNWVIGPAWVVTIVGILPDAWQRRTSGRSR